MKTSIILRETKICAASVEEDLKKEDPDLVMFQGKIISIKDENEQKCQKCNDEKR